MKPCTIDVSDSDMGQRQHEGDHQMATTTRPPTKTITMPSASETSSRHRTPGLERIGLARTI
jgi:hypothetical protein